MKSRLAAFRQGLEKLGWSEGRNVHIDYRFTLPARISVQALAKELIALQPDVILAHATSTAAALQRESRAIPIVFVDVSDPIGSGFIASLARPGGNLTGVLHYRGEHHRQVAGDAQGDRAAPCARPPHGQPQGNSL